MYTFCGWIMDEGNKVMQSNNIGHDMSKCGLEKGDDQDTRKWSAQMVQNPDLASQLDKGEDEEGA